jgi:predicted 2-oxoglutarate/Fe(II)-dependent dioxygenase YbiX
MWSTGRLGVGALKRLDPLSPATGLYLFPAFLSTQQCGSIRDEMLHSPTRRSSIIKRDGSIAVDGTFRRTTNVTVPETVHKIVDRYLSTHQDEINRHFGIDTSGRQRAQFLIYQPGDFFAKHRDDAPTSQMNYLMNRKISVVIILNDARTPGRSFKGGVLTLFVYCGGQNGEKALIEINPEEGLLLAFPSSLLHEVSVVESGLRFTLVSWLT